MYDLSSFPGNIHWAAVWKQAANFLALFFVVAFGSCMDIAAIQAECPFELDFDRELELIGAANGLCGAVGAGFTGSYIFSQTLFNFRWGAWGRAVGAVVASGEILLFLAPVSVNEYIPNFFFGGLMFWFGVDIAYDWLVVALGKVRLVEYALIWVSFVAVLLLGLEAGIGLGTLLAALQFTWEYARLSSSCVSAGSALSSQMRTYDQRSVLRALQKNIVVVPLSGYIFFGSALRLSSELKQLAESLSASRAQAQGSEGAPPAAEGTSQPMHLPKQRTAAEQLRPLAPSFMILDFGSVHGFDASSAQAFSGVKRKLSALGIDLIVCNVPKHATYITRLLTANRVIAPGSDTPALFESLDDGLRYCEGRVLQVAMDAGLCHPPVSEMSLTQALESHLGAPAAADLPPGLDLAAAAEQILPFLGVHELSEGEVLFQRGEPGDRLYIIQSGEVMCEALRPEPGPQHPRFLEFGPGSLLGDTDFFLQQPRSFKAWCSTAPCRLWTLTGGALAAVLESSPGLAVVIQAVALRSQCMGALHSAAALEPLHLP